MKKEQPPLFVKLMELAFVVALASAVWNLGFPWVAGTFVIVMVALIWP